MLDLARRTLGLIGIALLALGLGLVITPSGVSAEPPKADDWKAVLPVAELLKLYQESIKTLQDATKTPGTFTQKAKESPNNDIENEAYVVMLYAEAGLGQTSGEMAQKWGTVRDMSLALAKSAKDKKYDDAKKHVEALATFPNMKVDGNVKTQPTPLTTIPIKSLMKQVNAVGLKTNAHKRLTKAQFEAKGKTDEIAGDSFKMAALTMAITAHVPVEEEKDKPKKHWLDTTVEVRAATLDMAKAAKDKNQQGFRTALNNMDSACTKCHDKFRPMVD